MTSAWSESVSAIQSVRVRQARIGHKSTAAFTSRCDVDLPVLNIEMHAIVRTYSQI